MSTVKIKARGSSEIKMPPERGTVSARVGFDGPAAAPVFAATSAAADAVRRTVEELQAGGAVTWFSFDQVQRRSHRPWNQNGKQLPPVYSASVSLRVKFKDFDALGTWLTSGAEIDGLSVSGVEWALTEARRLDLERQARQAAVLDAKAKAQDYADALELGPVQVKVISDSGLVVEYDSVAGARYMSIEGAADQGLALSPEDVTVSAHVQGLFVVRDV